MPIGKLPQAITPQTRTDTSRSTGPAQQAPADGSFKGQSRVSGVKPLDASQPTHHPIVQSHVASAEEFHEDIRDFDELQQAGASHPDRLRDAGERVKVQASPYETPVNGPRPAEYEMPVSPYEVPTRSMAVTDHDYEDIDALRPREIFDHLAPKLPQPNAPKNQQPTPYETPVSTQRPVDYEIPVIHQAPADYEKFASPYEIPAQSKTSADHDYEDIDALRPREIFDHLAPKLPQPNAPKNQQPSPYETPVSTQRPADYETPQSKDTTEPIYAEIGPVKNAGIYDQLEPQQPANLTAPKSPTSNGGITGKETSV